MLLLLLVTDSEFLAGKGSVRIFTILFGFLVLVLLLPGLNIMVLQGTPEGKLAQTTARDLLEVARFVLIGVWPGNAEYCTTVRLNSPTYYAATLVMFLRWGSGMLLAQNSFILTTRMTTSRQLARVVS